MTMRTGFWLLVVAAGVLACSAVVDASHLAEQPKRHKVFYHLDEPGVDRAKAVLVNIENHVKRETFLAGGLKFDACQNTMARQKIDLKDVIEGATLVPSGVVRVMELQEAGYAYIKP
jgi:intracellular sulfur oxidation DsrE/DsrF family protein